MKCPDCGNELTIIQNWRMDEKLELIPLCKKCKVAFRSPELGWRIEENGKKE
jgi:hypothetical protein